MFRNDHCVTAMRQWESNIGCPTGIRKLNNSVESRNTNEHPFYWAWAKLEEPGNHLACVWSR